MIRRRVTLPSNWKPVDPLDLVARNHEHPVPCTSTVHGEPRTYICESHTRALYLAADMAFETSPDRAEETLDFQQEAVNGALERLGDNGLWIHNVSGEGETHFRFQLDGVDLLLQHFRRTGNPRYREGAVAALGAVVDRADELDNDALWFLHDTFETSWERKHARSPAMPASRVLGKSRANTMTLNTHLQALCVLERYSSLLGEARFEMARVRGWTALARVLALARHDWRARLLERCVLEAMQDPLAGGFDGLRRRLAWRLLARFYLHEKMRKPWFVHHSGYTDRDLGATLFHTGYHVLNLADLLALAQRQLLVGDDADPWAREVVDGGIHCCATTPYLERLEREGVGHPRPLYLDVLILRAVLDDDLSDERLQAILTEVQCLERLGYAFTLGTCGYDPYFVPESHQLAVRCEGAPELVLVNLVPRRYPRRVRLLCLNPEERSARGTVRYAWRWHTDRHDRIERAPLDWHERNVDVPGNGWLVLNGE